MPSAAALLALVFAVPVLRLARGHRRVRSGTAESRVLGAWRELRDGLRMCAVTLPPGHTVGDTLAVAKGLLPGAVPGQSDLVGGNLDRVGDAVNRVAFGAGPGVDDAGAAFVSEGVRRQLRALRATRSRRRRLTWWFDPRPLFWRSP